jgi:transposase
MKDAAVVVSVARAGRGDAKGGPKASRASVRVASQAMFAPADQGMSGANTACVLISMGLEQAIAIYDQDARRTAPSSRLWVARVDHEETFVDVRPTATRVTNIYACASVTHYKVPAEIERASACGSPRPTSRWCSTVGHRF